MNLWKLWNHGNPCKIQVIGKYYHLFLESNVCRSIKLILILLSFYFIVGCQITNYKKVESKTFYKKEDKTLIKTFVLKWDLDTNIITKLPKKIKEEANNICKNKKIVLIKINTNQNSKAIGTFKCLD